MKNLLLVLIILFSARNYAQVLTREQNQENMFFEAEKLLKAKRLSNALFAYQFVCRNRTPETEFKLKAQLKIDSLLPIIQNEKMKKWIGEWELAELRETAKFDYQKIIITDNKVLFYKNRIDKIASRVETIKIAHYNPNQYISTNRVVFENNEIWAFNVEKHQDKLFVQLKTDSIGTTYSSIEVNDMIIDRKEFEKAISEKIKTYYIRMK